MKPFSVKYIRQWEVTVLNEGSDIYSQCTHCKLFSFPFMYSIMCKCKQTILASMTCIIMAYVRARVERDIVHTVMRNVLLSFNTNSLFFDSTHNAVPFSNPHNCFILCVESKSESGFILHKIVVIHRYSNFTKAISCTSKG